MSGQRKAGKNEFFSDHSSIISVNDIYIAPSQGSIFIPYRIFSVYLSVVFAVPSSYLILPSFVVFILYPMSCTQ